MNGAICELHHTSSWCGAYLIKHGENFTPLNTKHIEFFLIKLVDIIYVYTL
jgi:hypothetical protein